MHLSKNMSVKPKGGRREQTMITLNDFPLKLADHQKAAVFYLDDAKFQLRNQMAYYHSDDFPIPMHKHDFFELNIIVQGIGCHYIEGNRFIVKCGDTLMIPPNVRHGYVPYDDKNFSIFHLLVDKQFFIDYSKDIETIPYMEAFLNIEPMVRINNEERVCFLNLNEQRRKRIFPFLSNLVHLAKKQEQCVKTFNFYTLGLMGELAYYMFEGNRGGVLDRDNISLNILKSIDYMNTHFQEEITLNELAHFAHMSRSEYCLEFKKLFNDTPIHFLMNIRLNKAEKLLRDDNLSITEISLECGFFDNSHMTRYFRQKYNMSPREYRKKKYKYSNWFL